MMARRSEEVFLLTLVDLLLQICFFGLFAFLAYQFIQSKLAKDQVETQRLQAKAMRVAGVSSLTELTDYLSRLAPPDQLRGFSEFYLHGGRIAPAVAAEKYVQSEGGRENIQNRLEKLRKLEEGFGKPPCLWDLKDGKRVDRRIAVVEANDTSIRIVSTTDDFTDVLKSLGTSSSAVQELPFKEFTRTFAPLRVIKSDCLYSVEFHEKTRFVDARDSASMFRLAIRKK